MIIEIDPQVAMELGLRNQRSKNIFTESEARRPMYSELDGRGWLLIPDWAVNHIQLDQSNEIRVSVAVPETTEYIDSERSVDFRLNGVTAIQAKAHWLDPWDRHLLAGGQR